MGLSFGPDVPSVDTGGFGSGEDLSFGSVTEGKSSPSSFDQNPDNYTNTGSYDPPEETNSVSYGGNDYSLGSPVNDHGQGGHVSDDNDNDNRSSGGGRTSDSSGGGRTTSPQDSADLLNDRFGSATGDFFTAPSTPLSFGDSVPQSPSLGDLMGSSGFTTPSTPLSFGGVGESSLGSSAPSVTDTDQMSNSGSDSESAWDAFSFTAPSTPLSFGDSLPSGPELSDLIGRAGSTTPSEPLSFSGLPSVVPPSATDSVIEEIEPEGGWLKTIGERLLPSLGATATMNKLMGGIGSAAADLFPGWAEIPVKAAIGTFTSRLAWPAFKKPQDALQENLLGVEPEDPAEEWFDEGDLLPGFFSAGSSVITAKTMENLIGPATTWANYGKTLLSTTAISSGVFVVADAIGKALYDNVDPYKDLVDTMDSALLSAIDAAAEFGGEVYKDGPDAFVDLYEDLATPSVEIPSGEASFLDSPLTEADREEILDRAEAYEEFIDTYGSKPTSDGVLLPPRVDAPTFEEFYTKWSTPTQEEIVQELLDLVPESGPSVQDQIDGLPAEPTIEDQLPDLPRASDPLVVAETPVPLEPPAPVEVPSSLGVPPSEDDSLGELVAGGDDAFEFEPPTPVTPTPVSVPGPVEVDEGNQRPTIDLSDDGDRFVFTFPDDDDSSGGLDSLILLPCLRTGDPLQVALDCYNQDQDADLTQQDVAAPIVSEFFGPDGLFDGDNRGLFNSLLTVESDLLFA